jgi:hypothetical protein
MKAAPGTAIYRSIASPFFLLCCCLALLILNTDEVSSASFAAAAGGGGASSSLLQQQRVQQQQSVRTRGASASSSFRQFPKEVSKSRVSSAVAAAAGDVVEEVLGGAAEIGVKKKAKRGRPSKADIAAKNENPSEVAPKKEKKPYVSKKEMKSALGLPKRKRGRPSKADILLREQALLAAKVVEVEEEEEQQEENLPKNLRKIKPPKHTRIVVANPPIRAEDRYLLDVDKFIETMKACGSNSETQFDEKMLASLMKICTRRKNFDLSLKLFNSAIAIADESVTVDSPQPALELSTLSYNAALNTLGKAGKLIEMQALIARMKEGSEGVIAKPNIASFTTVINE